MGKHAATRPSICYHPSQYLAYPHRRYCDDSWEALQRPIAKPPTTRRRHSDKNESFFLSNDAETWVYTLDGERYRNKTTISQWEQILEDGFLRTHRSFMVNINHVTKAESDAVMLGEITIPVSRKYKEVVATKMATTT